MFLTICYVSNASAKLSPEEIKTLMLDAKMFNDANNISGLLVYSDCVFFQVIEGEYEIVSTLYKRIKQDFRHYNILKILETKSEDRKYYKYKTKFIISYTNRALKELLKLLKNSDRSIKDERFHNLILYQSNVLLSLA